jgi:hypothetical protein
VAVKELVEEQVAAQPLVKFMVVVEAVQEDKEDIISLEL